MKALMTLLVMLFAVPSWAAPPVPASIKCKVTQIDKRVAKTDRKLREVQIKAQIIDWMSFARTLWNRGHPTLAKQYEKCGFQLALHHLKLNKTWAPIGLRITLSYRRAPTRDHIRRVCDLLTAARKRGMDAPAHPSCASLKNGSK